MTELADLQSELAFNQKYLGEISEKYSTYSKGREIIHTVGNIEDINRIATKIKELNTRIDNILNPPAIIIPVEHIPEPSIIEEKPNITPNTNDQFGNSLEPVITQIQKPENKGLILISGLITAAILLK